MYWMYPLCCVSAIGIGWAVSSTASAADYTCVPLEVSVLSNRAHIECAAPAGKTRGGYPVDTGHSIVYFAVPIIEAGRFVYLANLSITSGMPMMIHYTSGDYSGEAYSCARTNCRKPEGYGLRRTARLP